MSSHHPHPYSSQQHQQQHPQQQPNSIEPKRFNGFFAPSATTTPTPTLNNNSNNHLHFNSLFGFHQAHQHQPNCLQFTDDELIESLLHRQNPITQPISFDQITLLDHSHSKSNLAHHQPIPITTTPASNTPDPDSRSSFSSSVPIDDHHHHLLLSPSSTNPTHSPSAIRSLSRTAPTAHHQTFRSSRSPNPKPLLNRRPQQANNYPFSPPTSITTTLPDEERSPAISTISVSESSSTHHLSSSQPIGNSFYRSLASADEPAGLRSPLDTRPDELSASLPARRTFSPHSIVDQQKLVLNEKRRKRRESHNAVERRRRDNINDRITELAGLLPACLLDTVVTPNESGMMMVVNEEPSPTDDPQALTSAAHTKPNKGMILAKSVDYIKHLKHLLDLQSQRNTELEAELKNFRSTTEPHQKEQFTHKGNDEDQERRRGGEDQDHVQGEKSAAGEREETRDQIHQWIEIHDQQADPLVQNDPRHAEDNEMMMITQDAHSYMLDDHPLPPSTSNNHQHHAHHLSSEPLKYLDTHFSSSHDHFAAPFNHRLGSLENLYYQLQ